MPATRSQAMSSRSPSDYIGRIEGDLRGNILPFWIGHAVNPKGGFLGSLTNDLRPDPSVERGALLTARILWTFSAAYREYRDPIYLQMAERAYADLMGAFHDAHHGGFWWSVASDGAVLRDRKQVYGQAFAIYALSEYHAATGLREPLYQAIAVYRLIEGFARDRRDGGYFEAFSREWEPIADQRLSAVDQNDPKSQNTHLHVLEAYTRLLNVWPDPVLRIALSELLEIMLTRIADPESGHLGLFFTTDWVRTSERISYGHDIEAAWLFTRAAEAFGDPVLTARVHRLAAHIADVTLAEGVDADGGVFNEGGPGGLTNTNKEWWPQAEAVVGFLNAYQISRHERYLAAALRTWDFIEARLIDRANGEWFRGVTREGDLLAGELKVSFWKCPYHNGRTGLEAVHRLKNLVENPEG